MAEKTTTYPLRKEDILTDPYIKNVIQQGEQRISHVSFVPLTGQRKVTLQTRIKIEDVLKILEEAKQRGTLEPLTTLATIVLPEGYTSNDKELKEKTLQPYLQYVEELQLQLAGDITFAGQMPSDNTWGDMVLNSGKFLLRSGDKFVPYAYSIEREERRRVVFERLPDIHAPLEEAVEMVHTPSLIESIIRVRAKRTYPIRETMLPFFAYRLLGI